MCIAVPDKQSSEWYASEVATPASSVREVPRRLDPVPGSGDPMPENAEKSPTTYPFAASSSVELDNASLRSLISALGFWTGGYAASCST